MYFVGRQREIEQVEALLERFHFVSLLGPAGVGKTALALELVRRHAASGTTTRLVLIDGEASTAERLAELPRLAAEQPETRWVATTRSRLWLDVEALYRLGPMRLDDAAELLDRRLDMAAHRPPPTQLRAVAARLDGFPAALVEAAAAIELTGLSGLFGRVDAEGVRAMPGARARLMESWAGLGTAAKAVFAAAITFAGRPTASQLLAVAGKDEGLRELVDHAVLECVVEEPPRFEVRPLWEDMAPALQLPDVTAAHARWASGSGQDPELLVVYERVQDGTLADASLSTAVLDARARRALFAADTVLADALCEQAAAAGATVQDEALALSLKARLMRSSEPGPAVAAYEAALALLPPSDPMRASLAGELAAARWEAGAHSEGRRELERARQAAIRAGDVRAEGIATSNLGVAVHLAGDWTRALRLHEQALVLHRRAAHGRFEAIAHFDLGALFHESGAVEKAAAHYRTAVDGLKIAGDMRLTALVRAALGAAEARLGLASGQDPGALSEWLGAGGHAVYARGAELYARLARAVAGAAEAFDTAPYDDQPDEVQVPARLLAQLSRAMAASEVLTAGPALDRFRIGEGTWVDLSNRVAYRGIFAMLCQRRLGGEPGASLEDLISAGWPGERVTAEAARNRAHVALSSLRRLGLTGVIEKGKGGYALSAQFPLVIAPAPHLRKSV